MPGIFDFLGSLLGGGGDGSDPFGGVDFSTPDYSSFGSNAGSSFTDIISGAGGSGAGSGLFGNIDPSGFGLPSDAYTPSTNPFAGSGTGPFDFSTVDPNTFALPPGMLGGAAGGGGTPIPLQTVGTAATDISKILAPGQAPQIPAGSLTTGLPGTVTPPASGVAGTISNLLGTTPGTGVLGTGITLPQLLAGLGLGGSLLQGNQLPPAAGAAQKIADDNQALVTNSIMPTALANQQGQINGQALSAIDRRLQESEAAMRSKYASMGMSGSTMEQEDLAGLRANAQDQVFAEGQQMATTGLATAAQLTGQDATIYNELMQAQVQQDEELSKAIAAFAGALAK